MNSYLVDTTVWIDFSYNKKTHKQRILAILRRVENN